MSINLHGFFCWFAPTMTDNESTEIKLEQFYINGMDFRMLHQKVLLPGKVMRISHPGIGLGPLKQNLTRDWVGYPYWKNPEAGVYKVSQSLEFNVTPVDAKDPKVKFDWSPETRHKFTTADLQIEIQNE